jgi:hypothetical protein
MTDDSGTGTITTLGTEVGTANEAMITADGYDGMYSTYDYGTLGTQVTGTITGLGHDSGTITTDGTETMLADGIAT